MKYHDAKKVRPAGNGPLLLLTLPRSRRPKEYTPTTPPTSRRAQVMAEYNISEAEADVLDRMHQLYVDAHAAGRLADPEKVEELAAEWGRLRSGRGLEGGF